MAKHNEIGKLGEHIAANFLEQKGFKILFKNYWKPYGEIDIIAERNLKTHFIEVKSVSYETGRVGDPTVSYGTGYRPEENVHPQKIKRLLKVIQAFLVSYETVGEWQFDVIAVYIDKKAHKSKVKWLKDIILGE